ASTVRAGWPAIHHRQRPQLGTQERTTRSPSFSDVTPGPIAVTVPEPSWPMTSGAGTSQSPLRTWRSEWHTPAAAIFTRTSPSLGSSSWTSVTSTGWSGSRKTTARTAPRYQGGPAAAPPQAAAGRRASGRGADLTLALGRRAGRHVRGLEHDLERVRLGGRREDVVGPSLSASEKRWVANTVGSSLPPSISLRSRGVVFVSTRPVVIMTSRIHSRSR